MDINPAALEPIVALTERMEKQTGRRFKITSETDLQKAACDADYIVISIAVGGLKAMEQDLKIPEAFGMMATVGDTVGPSGMSRLLRNAPVFLDLAQKIEEAAPGAWVINISNPLTALTRLISQRTKLKTLGLCSGIINHLWILKDLLGFEDLSQINFTVAGIDHCSWFLKLRVQNEDIYPRLRRLSVDELKRQSSFGHSRDEWSNLDSLAAGFTLFENLGYLPAISDRHLGEFFPFFISSLKKLKQFQMKRTTIQHRLEWGKQARKKLQEIIEGHIDLNLVKTRDIVVDVINALEGAGTIRTTVNYPNQGQIVNLPPGSIVETCATIRKGEIIPEEVGVLPPQLQTIVYPHIIRQELVLQAALKGSKELFTAALVSDPTVQDPTTLPELVDRLLQGNSAHLPRFRT
jgi:alpha-galactosidase